MALSEQREVGLRSGVMLPAGAFWPGSAGRDPASSVTAAPSCLPVTRGHVSWFKGDLINFRPLPGVLAFHWGILSPFSTFYFEGN